MDAVRTLDVAWLGTVDYAAALTLQYALVAARMRDAIGDTLLLLEHPHVFTLGRGADARYLIDPPAGVPVYRVSRGGQVTYHGPGQLIGYPILKLSGPERDVGRYLRGLEQAIIGTLARFGIASSRREGMTGVWTGSANVPSMPAASMKIASIGVGLRRWISLHGFALNVTTDLSMFDAIVPCGIEGCTMTSAAAAGAAQFTLNDFVDEMTQAFAAVFNYDRVVAVAPRELWRLADNTAQECEVWSRTDG